MQSVCAHVDVPSCVAVSWVDDDMRDTDGYDGVMVRGYAVQVVWLK